MLTRGESGLFIRKLAISSIVNIQSKIDNQYASPRSKRKPKISNTRAIISYLAAIELGYTGAKIASELRLSEKSVSRCLPRRSRRSYWGIERGQKFLDNDKELLEHLQ